VERRFPDVRVLRSLLARSGRESHGIERRLSRILTIWDIREAARRRVPHSVFDYVDGAADQELTLSACRCLFSHLQFAGSVLRDVSEVDTSCTVFGKAMALPLIWLDGGVMSGSDVVAALALGARCVLVGRAYLYGLMTGGEPGVERVVDIVTSEIRRTMQLLGAKS